MNTLEEGIVRVFAIAILVAMAVEKGARCPKRASDHGQRIFFL
jgi:hypothetical protein